MLLYPKFEKLATQRGVAKLLIVLFSSLAFIGFMLILYKYYLVSTNGIRDYFEYKGIDSGSIVSKPFVFNNNYFFNLYLECFSGFLIVVAWLTLIKETQKIGGDPDWGLAWLAVAIFFWCFGDLINIAIEFHNGLGNKELHMFNESTKSTIGRVVSSLNSFCFLYSLRYLEFNENSKWKKFRDRIEEYHSIPLVAFLLGSLIIITIILGLVLQGSDSKLIYVPDLIVSIITTAALWVFFTEYFKQRKIKYMKYLIIVVVLVIIIVQVSQVFDQNFKSQFYMHHGAPILSMIYRPFLMMLFLLIAFSSLGNEKEKQAILERQDMNHAIRGSLHIISRDVERLVKKEKVLQNYKNTFVLQDFAFRAKSIYDLHNLIHNEYGEAKISLKKYLQHLIENAKYAFDYTHLDFHFVGIDNIYVERTLLRKIGTVLTELITNAAKEAIKKNQNKIDYPNFKLNDKLLIIKVENHDILLNITVGDNGIYNKDIFKKINTGHGLSLIKRTIIEDFEGKLSLHKNQYNGTEICLEIPLSNLI